MSQMFIPSCGVQIKLTEDWTFTCYNEMRNHEFRKSYGVQGREPISVTVKAGTILTIDRVYIRQFNKSKSNEDSYDSITFRTYKSKKDKARDKKVEAIMEDKFPGGRFWAKLHEVNNIQYEIHKTIDEVKAELRAKKK